MKRAVVKAKKRRPLKKHVEEVQRRVEDRLSGVADRCMDVVDQNLDAWMNKAVDSLLAKVGLDAPYKVSVKGQDGKMIELTKQKDGSYA